MDTPPCVKTLSVWGLLENFFVPLPFRRKQRAGLPLVFRHGSCGGCGVGERKVRAAQSVPLPNIEAIGDSRCRQKKTTAVKSVWAQIFLPHNTFIR